MNSKQIGNIGEAKVLSKFIELGFPVYIPFGDNEKADLVVEFNGKLNKVQVKTSIDAKNGNVIFDLTSSTAHRKNGMRHKYTIDEVDYFALYNLCRDKIYLLKVPETPIATIRFRYEYPKNGQTCGVHFEDDYLIDNILKSGT
jgi:hypothetical protein